MTETSLEKAGGRSPSEIGWLLIDAAIVVRRRARGLQGHAWSRYLPALPALAALVVLGSGLGQLLWASIHSFNAFTFTSGGFSIENFTAIASDSYTRMSFIRGLTVGVAGGAIATTVSVPLAYVLVRTSSAAARVGLLVVIFVPLLTGDVVRGLGWLSILGPQGLLSLITVPLGLGRPQLIGTGWAVVVGIVQTAIPFAVLSIVPSVNQLDPILEQAATTLGARPSSVWRYVVLPSIRPGLATAFAVTAALAIGDFANPAILGQGRFDFAANAVESAVLGRNNLSAGSALSVVLSLLEIGVLSLILVRGRARPQPVPGRSGS